MSERGTDAFGIGRRRLLVSIAVAVALVVGASALIGQAANYHRLAHAAERAQVAWLPLCLAGELLAYAGYILAYRDVARVGGGPRLSPWTATRVVVLGFGAFAVGAGAGGLAADFWALNKASGRAHQSARRVLGMNTLEWGVLGCAAWVAALLVLAGVGHGAPTAMTLAWLLTVPVCIALGLWFTQPSRVQRFTRLRQDGDRPHGVKPGAWVRWLALRARTGLADAIGGVMVVRAVFAGERRYVAGVAGFPIYWAGDILTLYAALRAFGISPDVPALVLAYTSGYVIAALPLPAGGAGATEATIASTLHLIGVAYAPALLAAVVYRVFSFWLPIIPALLFLPLVGGLSDDLEHTPLQDSDAPLAELTGEANEDGDPG